MEKIYGKMIYFNIFTEGIEGKKIDVPHGNLRG